MKKLRIEIRLDEHTADIIEQLAQANNNSRKAYIELVIMNHAKSNKPKKLSHA